MSWHEVKTCPECYGTERVNVHASGCSRAPHALEAQLDHMKKAIGEEAARLREFAEGYAPETGIRSAYYDAADRLEQVIQDCGGGS